MSSTKDTASHVAHVAWPLVDDEVWQALQSAYQTGDWGRYHGPHGDALRRELATVHGSQFVRLTCSGTVAVELALAGVGVQPGSEVVLAGYDFAGNFRAIEHLGAKPVIVDIDAELRLTLAQLQLATTLATQAVIISHLHGSLTSMVSICEWAQQRGVAVIEDACQAPGALIDGRLAGTWGDVGVHSFGGSKLLTAGRGGAVITDDPAVDQRMKIYAERGNDAYPMSELQAAVLIPQLRKLSHQNKVRQTAAGCLATQLQPQTAIRPVGLNSWSHASCYKLAMELSPELLARKPRATWIEEAQARGVSIDAGFRGFARRSARRCRRIGELDRSRRAGEALVVLHHPVLLSDADNLRRLGEVLDQISQPEAP